MCISFYHLNMEAVLFYFVFNVGQDNKNNSVPQSVPTISEMLLIWGGDLQHACSFFFFLLMLFWITYAAYFLRSLPWLSFSLYSCITFFGLILIKMFGLIVLCFWIFNITWIYILILIDNSVHKITPMTVILFTFLCN